MSRKISSDAARGPEARPNRLRVTREFDGTIDDRDFPQSLMIRLDHDAPRNCLRLRQHSDAQDGRMPNLMLR